MQHGGDLTQAIARTGIPAADWLDLSTGINPRPYPVPQISSDAWQRLPSAAALDDLLTAARAYYNVPDGVSLIAAPGTQSLIQLLPQIIPEGAVAVVGPTYGPHTTIWNPERSVDLSGATSSGIRNTGWVVQGRRVTQIADFSLLPENAKIAIVTNPNNPGCKVTTIATLHAAAETMAQRHGYLIIDEAFADIDPTISFVDNAGLEMSVIILRSFGKFFGLAGIRLGFLIASPLVACRFADKLGEWAVPGPAIEIGTAALTNTAWQTEARTWIASAADDLASVLETAGLTLLGNVGLFCLAEHPDAGEVHEGLAEMGIWCRKFDYAPTWLRFGLPGSPEELNRLRMALERFRP